LLWILLTAIEKILKHSKINKINYLEAENILLIHSAIISEIGGSHGVRDIERVGGIIAHPQQFVFGKEVRKGIFEKAAAYGHDIIKYHPFIDGNKRTGMTSMAVFLELNGYRLEVKEGMIEKMAISIIIDKLEIPDIASWLQKWSKKKN